jgi:hypothetical protein
MMQKLIRGLLAGSVCALACWPAWSALEMDGVVLEDSVQVGGKSLKLNGAGISMRMMFKIYAMGLYLPHPRGTPQDVLAADGPRRLAITMLRSLRSVDFQGALSAYVNAEGTSLSDVAATGILQISRAVAEQTPGLNKGDQLTLDWVPGMGTVVELNKRPVSAPVRDIAVYNALLNIWLGEHPADPSLKDKLLGRSGVIRAALNY